MKIYLFYLKIKDSDFKSLRHTILLNPYEYTYNEDYNYYIGFYAWTKKKSDIEKFFKIRKKKMFYMKTKELDKEEFQKFKIEKKMFELKSVEIEEKKLLLTKEEYIAITFETPEMFYDLFMYTSFDYTVLKPDFQDAADFIGYASAYDRYIGGEITYDSIEDIDARREVAEYNIGYAVTLNGYDLFILEENPMSLFILFYGFFLKKDFIYMEMLGGIIE